MRPETNDGSRLGNEGLQQSLPVRRGDAQSLLDAVVHGVNDFRGACELCDDLTLVAIRLSTVDAPRRPQLVHAMG